MWQYLKKQWREINGGKPGRRFQELHCRRQLSRGSPRRRQVAIGVAGCVLVGGIVMMPLPGPGFPIVLVGAALLARESSRAARALDWLELKCRNYTARGLKAWGAASLPLKIAIFLMATLSLGAAAWAVSSLTALPERARALARESLDP
jgi:uncharacterized protein (TIGR02611 family)